MFPNPPYKEDSNIARVTMDTVRKLLADYYADVATDGAEAVKWAGKDQQLRENFNTQAALAWAFYRDGRFDEARRWIERALASGAVDAHLFLRAAQIYAASGSGADGQNFVERAMRLNLAVDKFHVHH